jgi:hypothetical protein
MAARAALALASLALLAGCGGISDDDAERWLRDEMPHTQLDDLSCERNGSDGLFICTATVNGGSKQFAIEERPDGGELMLLP